MSDQKHVMIDLETYGTEPGCIIRSIGAVMFDPYSNQIGGHFYRNIDHRSCIDIGLTMDPKTKAWWDDPARADAQEHLAIEPVAIHAAVEDFDRFFYQANEVKYAWAHGTMFDLVLWEAASRKCGYRGPLFDYRNARDTRTCYDMLNFDPKTLEREGVHHNALDDCLYQIKCVQQAMEILG